MVPTADFTIGVEEEFLVVDGASGRLVPRGPELVDAGAGRFDAEFHQALVESATGIHVQLADLHAELSTLRRGLVELAHERGLRIVSAGAIPTVDLGMQEVTDGDRFGRMLDDYQHLAREQVICGLQTHVGFADRGESIEVMNRARPWLPVLLALSGSSPYVAGTDTGYDSYRVQQWSRWPTAGMPAPFRSWEEYQSIVRELVVCGAIADTAMIYWWLRPSQHAPTIEFRIADAATTVDEAVMIAGLSRAIARMLTGEVRNGVPDAGVGPEWLDVATWRASRFGLAGDLLDPVSRNRAPATEVVSSMVQLVQRHLEHDERDRVLTTLDRVLAEGNSATRQRRAFARRERHEDVVDHLATETISGLS